MNQLPFEILNVSFASLGRKDLLQCQITSKLWHAASSQLLYSKVILDSKEKCKRYVLAITNTPRLGLYLKSVDVNFLFSKTLIPVVWDEHALMYALLQSCPNITEFLASSPNNSFWSQLNGAAYQSRLKYLQRLPDPTHWDFKLYSFTALLFKESLTTLVLNTIHASERYQLTTRIDEFVSVKTLKIIHFSKHGLTHYDGIIDNCIEPNTIIVHMDTAIYQILEEELPEIIQPRKDVYKLDCHWNTLDSDAQLIYIMQKFPKLQDLTISLPFRGDLYEYSTISTEVTASFLQYAYDIKTFGVTFKLLSEDLFEVWKIFARKTNTKRNVRIHFKYSSNESISRRVLVVFENSIISITVLADPTHYEITQIHFIKHMGHNIKSLKIAASGLHKPSYGETFLYKVLDACPSLQELIVEKAIVSRRECLSYLVHTKLKSLSISISEPNINLRYLKEFAFSIPNLKQLHLYNESEWCPDKSRHIQINLPLINFDLITWNCKKPVLIKEELQCLVRVETLLGRKFFAGPQKGLFQVTKESIMESKYPMCFDIICASLKDFKIIF